MKRYKLYILLVVVVLLAGFVWNGMKEQQLGDLLDENAMDFHSLQLTHNRQDEPMRERVTEDAQALAELLAFLRTYRVERIEEDQFKQHLKEERFELMISYEKANPKVVWLLEDHVYILAGDYYEVTNGPIALEWLREYVSE